MSGTPYVVSPMHFADAMSKHWSSKLGNEPSETLREVWITMAHTFGGMILGVYQGEWGILQPPTGTGKTEGSALYCAMATKYNDPSEAQVGILVVARTIEQAEEYVSLINKHADREVAIGHHHKRPINVFQMNDAEVLVITHQALVMAITGLIKETRTKWSEFVQWRGGRRNLVVIDEALSGLIEYRCLTLPRLDTVLSLIPERLRVIHKDEVAHLERLASELSIRRNRAVLGEKIINEVLWKGRAASEQVDLSGLMQALNREDLGKALYQEQGHAERASLKEVAHDVLVSAEAILNQYALYARKGDEHALFTSLLLIPKDMPPCVVLDATAKYSEVWELLGDRVHLAPCPPDARNYKNVTMNVATSRGLGKKAMKGNSEALLPRLYSELDEVLPEGAEALLVLHQDVKQLARGYKSKANISLVHWGALDGKNDWQDHQAVVLCGLSYRDNVWPIQTFFALAGPQDTAWLSKPSYETHENILRLLQQRQLSSAVIQAINRVRCRRVIDAEGNCLPTDVYIVLPNGEDGDAILAAITEAMPSVRVVPWSFSLRGPKANVRKASSHERLLNLLAEATETMAMDWVVETLNLSVSALKDLRTVLRRETHHLRQAMKELGFTYASSGKGKAMKDFIVKVT